MDRWKTSNLGQVLADDQSWIFRLTEKYNISSADADMLQEIHQDVFNQLSKAVTVGKIFQEVLLEYMDKRELAERLRREMLNVEITGGI